MYSDNIFADNDQAQKYILKQSYSNNDLLSHQKLSALSNNYGSTHSLPILLKEKTSFIKFLADEKYNLQFFRSFKETQKIIDKQKDKKLIRNFDFLPYTISNSYYSLLNNSKVFDDDNSPTTCVTPSSNFVLSTSSNISSTKKTKPMTGSFAHNAINIINIDKNRCMRCVERHISYMNHEQTKAALCFILQLNTYINQKMFPLQKDSNKINESYVQSKKLDVLPKNTTSILDFISKCSLNDAHVVETNDSIDISMQLSENPDCSSKIILKENDDSLAFYNRPIMANIFDKKINSIGSNDLLSNDETNIYNIVHSSLKKEGKVENHQESVTTINDRQKIIIKSEDNGLTKIKSKTDYDALNLNKMQNETFMKHGEFMMSTPCKFNDEMIISKPIPKIAYVTTIPVQRIQTSMKSIERIEMKDLTSNKTEINMHRKPTMLNSSLKTYNYHTSESSIDLRNLLNESTEKKSLIPLHSRCLVSFEFANREEHLIEVFELPRSFHRVSRMDIYKKIHERLVLMNLIDIDLTALIRTVLKSFS